jgi:beta-phosphoglucomutase
MYTKACIFDLDGVIVDTAKYHYLAWKRLADQLNIHFTEKDNERLKGVSRMASLEIILEIGNVTADRQTREQYAALKNQWYVDYICRMTPGEILPGSVDFIREIKKAGILVAIGSASRNTTMILDRVGIRNLFDAVADGNIVKKAKPDPEVFLKAAEMLKTEPKYCVVFEDAAAGVKAALNAGMLCVGIGSPEVLKEATSVVSGLDKMDIEELERVEKLSEYERKL